VKAFFRGAAAVALGASAVASLAPLAPAAAQEAGETVAIPFAPPVGQKITYRLERTISEDGPATKRAESRMEVGFRRAGTGYIMDARLVGDSLPAEIADDPAFAALTLPMSFRVNAVGEITGIEDEARYWAVFEQLVRKTEKPANAASGRAAVAALRALPDENRLAMLSMNVAPLLTLSASEFPLGETLEGEQEGMSPVGPVPQQVRVTLERVAGDRAHVTSVTTTSPAAFEAAVRDFIERAKGVPLGNEKFISMELRETYEVSLTTGLIERQVSQTTAEGEAGGKRSKIVRTNTLERLP
jgi:hypothetical protein